MRPAADVDSTFHAVVPSISVGLQIAPEPFQKSLGIIPPPAGLVFVQDNGMLRVRAGPVQPHIALRLRRFSRLVQNLYLSLVRVQKIPGEQQLPQFSVDRRKPIVGAAQQPVGHSLPGKHDALAVPLLLLPVKRRPHDIFLYRNVCNGLRRGAAPRNQCGLLWSLYDRNSDIVLFAVAAAVGHVDIPVQDHLGRDDFQRFADLFPNRLHHPAALRTKARLFRQLVRFFLNLGVFRKDLSGDAGALLSEMGLYLHRLFRFRLLFRRLLVGGGFVEHQAELFIGLIRELFRGGTEFLLSRKAQLLQEPFFLTLIFQQALVFRAGDRNGILRSTCRKLVLFHGSIVPQNRLFFQNSFFV